MGIDQAKTEAAVGILKREVAKPGRFPGACLADDMNVHQAISQLDPKRDAAFPVERQPKRADGFGNVLHRIILKGRCNSR